jgi:hypothetical protein
MDANSGWLSVRVRESLQPYEQHIEILRGDEVLGELWSVTGATYKMRAQNIGELTITMDVHNAEVGTHVR